MLDVDTDAICNDSCRRVDSRWLHYPWLELLLDLGEWHEHRLDAPRTLHSRNSSFCPRADVRMHVPTGCRPQSTLPTGTAPLASSGFPLLERDGLDLPDQEPKAAENPLARSKRFEHRLTDMNTFTSKQALQPTPSRRLKRLKDEL